MGWKDECVVESRGERRAGGGEGGGGRVLGGETGGVEMRGLIESARAGGERAREREVGCRSDLNDVVR